MIPRFKTLAGCILLVAIYPVLSAQEILRPMRIDTPPVIDGKLDEAFWQQAPVVGNFKTYNPDFGKVMSEATEVRMAYDSENL